MVDAGAPPPPPPGTGAPARPPNGSAAGEPRLSPDEDRLLASARQAYVEGRHEEAMALYDGIVEKYPQRAVFWNDRGVTLDALSRHKEAEKDYRRALELFGGYELAHRNLANCLVFQGRESEALEALLAAVDAEPDYEAAYRDALSILLSRGPGAGEVAFARRLASASRNPLGTFVLGVVAAEAGQTRAAVRELEGAVAALQGDEGAKQRLGDDFGVQLGEFEKALGNALFAREAIGEAVDAYRRSVAASPKDEEAWNNLGFAYYTAAENDLAIECFKRAVEVNPSYKHAWYNLAYTFQTIDLLEDAIRAYDRTLECDPNDEVAWNNRGNAEYNLGRYEASIPFFERAVELVPDYDIAWNNIGNALNKAGRHPEAVPFHERALKANPQFDYAWYALSKSRFHSGDMAGAVRDIERCLEVNRQFDSGWAMKAEIMLHLGDLDEALESAEQAVASNQENDHAHFVHAEVLEELGRTDAAEAAFERAIAIAGQGARIRAGVPDAWSAHGEMLLARGRFEEARASFRKAAEINPGSLIAREGSVEAMVRLGKYRDALLELRSTGAKEAPHEMIARMRLYLDTGEPAAVPPAAARYRQWYGDEVEVTMVEGEAMLGLGRPAEARAAFDRAARRIERKLSKERTAREKAKAAPKGGRSRAKAKRAAPAAAVARKGRAGEWVDVDDGRKQIRALQEEGSFLSSFAEEPSGEHMLLDELFSARLRSGQAARVLGLEQEARDLFGQASDVRPDRAEAWYNLGDLELSKGDFKAARAAFECAVGAEPGSELGWAGLARLAEATGKRAGAERLKRAVVRAAPGHPVDGEGTPKRANP
jgi:tetratricopeptide (TPR) repeat protein